jgi:hypothetical protein
MKSRRSRISGQFSARLIEMMQSSAFRALSLAGRRLLDRVEIEHGQHGGTDNGKLPVTFDQFCEYGLHRHSIAPGMREAVALGFLEVTQKGRAGNAEHRAPNLFRLTYRPSDGVRGDGSHEWRRIASTEEAEAIAAAARKAKSKKKTKNQCRKVPAFGDKNRHRNSDFPVLAICGGCHLASPAKRVRMLRLKCWPILRSRCWRDDQSATLIDTPTARRDGAAAFDAAAEDGSAGLHQPGMAFADRQHHSRSWSTM